MTYVDGYVLAIAKENLDAYREMADKAGRVWQEHGALEEVGQRWFTSFAGVVLCEASKQIFAGELGWKAARQDQRVYVPATPVLR